MTQTRDPSAAWQLAIETSSLHGSIALGRRGEALCVERFDAGASHAAQLMLRVSGASQRLGLDPRDLAEVHVSAGPGSFTGLRVAVATARMLALATGARLTRVDTLQVIAHNARRGERQPEGLIVMLDAKRGNVYTALYERRIGAGIPSYIAAEPPVEAAPDQFLVTAPSDAAVIGAGAAIHRAVVARSGRIILPEALFTPEADVVLSLGHAMAERGAWIGARDLVPIYVRRPEAEERWEQRHAQ